MTDRTYYEYDKQNVYTGRSVTINQYQTWPRRSTFTAPPDIPPGKFAKWQGEWVIIDEYPYPPVVAPEKIPKGQARRWLIKQGIMPSQVTQEINKIVDETERELAMSYWEDQTQYNRTNPLMIQIGAAFGFDTEEKLAQAFIAASEEE